MIKLKILVAGDLFIGNDFLEQRKGDPHNRYYQFCSIKEIFRSADLRFCNFEGNLSNQGRPRPDKSCHLYMPKEALEVLKFLKLDIVCLGNNHIMDYGDVALHETKELLRKNGICYFGAGKFESDLAVCKIVKKNGARVAFLGYTTSEKFCKSQSYQQK